MKEIHVAIHDLNPYGGQDRSTMEILKRLHKHFRLRIHAFTNTDPELQSVFCAVRPNLKRPVLLKAIYFYAILFAREIMGGGPWLWHSTGVSHLRSSVVHLQFIHKSWRAHRQAEDPRLLHRIYQDLLERFNILWETFCFREGKTYIAISESVARDLRKYFGIQKNIHVVYHGVDTRQFQPLGNHEHSQLRKSWNLSPASTVAVFVGSYERKGLEPLLRAVALLSETDRSRFLLVAVGDGNESHYRTLAESLGIQNNVRLYPKQKNISDFFQAADFFVLPTQYEPFGLVILEALSCGLPVITSRCAGASELIREGEEGYLLEDPRDPGAISAAIRKLLASPSKQDTMKQAARRLALQHDWDYVAEQYAKVLKTLDE